MGNVDIIIRLRAEGKEVLKDIAKDLEEMGHVQDDTRRKMRDFRTDTLATTRTLNAMGYTFRDQHQNAYLLADAFSAVGSIASQGIHVFNSYNIAALRVDSAQRRLTESTKEYNAVVAKFGAVSPEAIEASEKMNQAQDALSQSQTQNVAMFALFAAQAPRALKSFLQIGQAATKMAANVSDSYGGMTNAVVAFGSAAAIATGKFAAMVAVAVAAGAGMTKMLDAFGGPLFQQSVKAWEDRVRVALETLGILEKKTDISTMSFEDQVAWVLKTSEAHKTLADSIDNLTEMYAEGTISAGLFTSALLAKGVKPEEIEKILAGTIVHVKTWQEQFVGSAQTAASGFKDAFTGPMAQIGPAMSTAMSGLVTITNTAIQTGFIGQAQAGMAAFRDCISNKFYDLPGMAQQSIDSLVSVTNTAINSGLRGEAQKNIALFVQCASNKQLTMVQQIDGYLKQLQNQYKENEKQISIATMNGQSDRASLYEAENANILKVIDQLKLWNAAILSGKPITDLKITVSPIDTSPAVTSLQTIQAELGKIVSPNILISADAKGALDTITAVQNALFSLKDKTITVTVDYVSGVFPGGGGLPHLQYGGVVPGPIGQPQIVVAHGGEQYLGAPTSMTSHMTNYNSIYNNMDEDAMMRKMERQLVGIFQQRMSTG